LKAASSLLFGEIKKISPSGLVSLGRQTMPLHCTREEEEIDQQRDGSGEGFDI